MDLEIRRFSSTEILNSVSKNRIHSSSYTNPVTDLETNLIKSVIEDDRDQLIVLSKHLCFTTDSSLDKDVDSRRNALSKLLHLCCTLESINCAALLVSGELGVAAAVNMVDSATGKSPLHVAAESHAARCVEMLLKRRARTDVKSRDGRRLLALELSLSCSRMNMVWNPDKNSIEDLVVMLGDKDLTTVKLLSEKTKEIDKVAYSFAIGGRIVALATLLIVAAEKVNESILVLHDSEIGSKAKTTIYECVIREALSLGRAAATPLRAVKRTCAPTKSQSAEKRKLLLCEIELLQLFGAVACTDKKVTSPLILATQAGDETVIEILLKSNIDVNDTDTEENSALHCSLFKSSVVSTQQQNRILFLLLKRGAQVNQRNKLGLTALHIAAASGNVQAIQVLLLEDPECINAKTVTKETPLFFAVKNDHTECAELLLSWGAIAEVLNLRERPVDLAKSQDMRFLLSKCKISHLNRSLPVRRKCTTALVEGDEVISDACQVLLSMTDESTNTERICSISRTEVCKYFESSTGCTRGSKCFFAHSEEDLCKPKQGMHVQSSLEEENKRKIFVGGLPLTLDSDSLGKFFEQQFGSVEHARVSEIQKGKEILSRGFGFVIFKNEKSVSTAVQAHYVTIQGKQVEIKSCVPRNNLLVGNQKKSALPRESEHNDPSEPKAAKPGEKIVQEMQSVKTTTDEAKTEKMSWADRLLNGQPKTCPNESQTHISSYSSVGRKMPKWLKTLKKWLPRFLEDVYKPPTSEGGYALSSLKADFRAAFGLEMDHNSLGYTKLSDFMKTFPELCRVKVGTLCNRNGSPNHMVLVLPSLPNSTSRMLQPLQIDSPSLPAESIDDSGDGDSNASKCSQDLLSVSNGYSGFATSSTEENPSPEVLEDDSTQKNASTIVNSDEKNTSPDLHSMSVLFSLPDLFFDARKMWLYNNRSNGGGSGNTINERGRCLEGSKGVNLVNQERHLVLEALARKRNNSSAFFLREFNFYENYKASMKQGRCFGCNQREMLWANIPCQHLLWCGTCKIEATKAAGSYEHKCVVCDMIVQKFDLITPTKTYYQARIPNAEEFPPLYPSNIEILKRRRNLL